MVVDSGCESVGRAVASDCRDPRFESSHHYNEHLLITVLKRQNKEQRGQEWPIFKKEAMVMTSESYLAKMH